MPVVQNFGGINGILAVLMGLKSNTVNIVLLRIQCRFLGSGIVVSYHQASPVLLLHWWVHILQFKWKMFSSTIIESVKITTWQGIK